MYVTEVAFRDAAVAVGLVVFCKEVGLLSMIEAMSVGMDDIWWSDGPDG